MANFRRCDLNNLLQTKKEQKTRCFISSCEIFLQMKCARYFYTSGV